MNKVKNNLRYLFLFSFFAVTLITGCVQPLAVTLREKKLTINSQNYPIIDGSTSALPIIQEIYKLTHDPEIIDGNEIWENIPQEVSKTIDSYKFLIDGKADLIIVADPSDEIRELVKEKNVELEYVPICREALIFIVNNEITVNDVSEHELRSIYTDMKINNWAQIGGVNCPIEVLTRNYDSGSYALLEKYVLHGEKVNEKIEQYNTVLTMVAIVEEIEKIERINNSTSRYKYLPLGYTLYYYFQNNKTAQKWDNVKILNINGIEPNSKTIASGEYPYSTNYYAVIRGDASEHSAARILLTWLSSSDESLNVFINAGFEKIDK